MLFMGIAWLSLFSCQETEKPVGMDILGEWKIDGRSTEVLLNGEVKTLAEMGKEVFGLEEESAKTYVEEYLQNQILGPLSLEDAEVSFSKDLMTVNQGGNQRQSIWQLLNEKTVLKLNSLEENQVSYFFNFNNNSVQQINLSWGWQVQHLSDPTKVHDLELKLRLIK
jgi:sugar-specific transcriptional regulator TrmB